MDYKNKLKDNRVHKFTNSYGVRDALKWYRKLKDHLVVSDSTYYTIIREVNKQLIKYLLKGLVVGLPHLMGHLELKKIPNKLELVNNKIVTTRPVDWENTLKLWENDLECRLNKQLVRFNTDETYRVYYTKINANYKGRKYFEFKTNRKFKLLLKDKINNNEIDAFNLWQNSIKV